MSANVRGNMWAIRRILSVKFRLVKNIRTISSIHKGFHLWILDFSILIRIYVWADGKPAFLLCCFRLGKILHGNAFAGIGFDVLPLRNLGDFHIPYKSVIDNDSLSSAFASTLCFKNINVVNKFTQKRCGQSVHSQKITDCRCYLHPIPLFKL